MRAFLAGAVVPWRCKGRRGAYAFRTLSQSVEWAGSSPPPLYTRSPAMKRPGQILSARPGLGKKGLVQRRCLRCGIQFLSTSRGNRICGKCAGRAGSRD